jgi:hypothetical protein
LWRFALVIASFSTLLFVLCWCVLLPYCTNDREDTQLKKSEAKKAKHRRYVPGVPGSDVVSTSTSRMSSGTRSSMYGAVPAGPSRPTPAAWLCPQLMVPSGSQLHCAMRSTVSCARQELVVQVCSGAELGSAPLFEVRVADGGPEGSSEAGIFLQTPGGEGQLASLSTREVWARPAGREPELEIMKASGKRFGTLTKSPTGSYIIASKFGTVAFFDDHFVAPRSQVQDGFGATLAEVISTSEGIYNVTVNPNIDAGLIVLGLLAIDKMKRPAT